MPTGPRPLPELVDDYARVLADRGNTPEHVALVRARLLRLAGWRTAADIGDTSLLRGLARLSDEGGSHQTRNHYRTHARAFASWLGDRLGKTLLSRGRHLVPSLPAEADPRHPRRCPTQDEVTLLLGALDGGPLTWPEHARKWTRPPWPVRCGLTSRQHAMAYRLAMGTGLRADEVRSLTRSSFALIGRIVPGWPVPFRGEEFLDGHLGSTSFVSARPNLVYIPQKSVYQWHGEPNIQIFPTPHTLGFGGGCLNRHVLLLLLCCFTHGKHCKHKCLPCNIF